MMLAFLLLAASCAVEAAALTALLGSSTSLLSFVALHLASAGLAAEALRVGSLKSDFPGSRSIAAAAAFLTLAFPGLGLLMVAYLLIARPTGTRSYIGKASLQSQRTKAAQDAMERKRAEQQVEASVRSVADALKDRDKDVRIAAVESLRGEVSKKAVQFLEASQMNTIFDVRVLAIDNLNLVRDQCRQKLKYSRAKAQDDAVGLDALLAHAKLCMEQAEIGIEDTDTNKALYEEAYAYAARVSAQAGAWSRASEVRFLSATVLRALDRYQEAEIEYRAILELDRANTDAIFGLAEMQFQLRSFVALRTTCRQLVRAKAGELDADLTQVMRMWLNTENPRT